jgi:hypothetical protein
VSYHNSNKLKIITTTTTLFTFPLTSKHFTTPSTSHDRIRHLPKPTTGTNLAGHKDVDTGEALNTGLSVWFGAENMITVGFVRYWMNYVYLHHAFRRQRGGGRGYGYWN